MSRNKKNDISLLQKFILQIGFCILKKVKKFRIHF